ncbi:MAG TPA: DUF402 domain-containing protein [Pyrinomonadaceae bacterium]
MITVNSRKYDGTIRRSWTCEIAEQSDSLLVLVGEFDDDVMHSHLGHIKKGTLSYEYYWLDRWYNVFRFHEPSGSLRNFYCNLNMPPEFSGGILDYVDLDIDILVWPDYDYVLLDHEEYERNAKVFGYPAEVDAKVEAGLKELLELIETRSLPNLHKT